MAQYSIPIERFIKLRCQEALSRQQVRQWYRCVAQQTPPGLCRSLALLDDDNRPHHIAVIHRRTAHSHCYLIPLTRDLLEREVEPIARASAQIFPTIDFDLEISDTRLLVQSQPPVSLSAANYIRLCAALSKRRHEDWVRERTDAGWRYGLRFSVAEKTHPLLRPWSEIPERYRRPDLTGPQTLFRMLDQQGYVVVDKADLPALAQVASP